MLGVAAALAGFLGIFGAYWVINAPQAKKPDLPPHFACDSLSPDGLYGCEQSMAHNGWCSNGEVEWRYESWAIGDDDHTRAAPPAADTTVVPKGGTGRQRRIPRPMFWIGIALVAGIANYQYDTNHQTPPPPQYDCDWQVTKCVNWERR